MHEAPEMLPGDVVYIALALQRGRSAPGLVVQPLDAARIEVVYEHPDGRIVGGHASWSCDRWCGDDVQPQREGAPPFRGSRLHSYTNQLLRYLDDPQQMQQHAASQDQARRRRRSATS